MKKSIKLLSILLLACIFVSVMVIGASAVTNSDLNASRFGSGITNGIKGDYTSSIPTTALSSSVGFNWTGFSKTTDKTLGNNRFISLTNEDVPSPPSQLLGDSDAGMSFKNSLGSTAQKFTGGYLVYDIDLANISFDTNIPYANVGYISKDNAYLKPFYIVANGTGAEREYYVSLDATLDANDIKLSSDENVWNHITFVVSDVGDAAGKAFVFVDGQYLGNQTFTGNYQRDQRFIVTVGGISETNYNVTFNIDIDNIAMNIYDASYVSGSNNLGKFIDALYAGTGSTNLYNCSDIIYNKDYTYTSAVAGQEIVKIDYENSSSVSYHTLAAFYAANIDASDLNGATITARRDIDITELSKEVEELTVICKDGAKLTYSNTCENVNKTTTAGVDTYTFGDFVLPEDDVKISLKANLTLHDQFKFNIYIPADTWATVISTKINGVNVSATQTEINEADYFAISHPIKANAAKDAFTLAIELTNNAKTLTKEYTFSIPDYMDRVREGEYTAAAKTLMDATENYINAVYNFAKSESNTVVTTYDPTKTGTTDGKFSNVKINLALTDSIVFQFTASTATDMRFMVPAMENGKFVYQTHAPGVVTSYDVKIPVRFLNEGIIIEAEGKSGKYYIDDYINATSNLGDPKLAALTNAIGAYAKAANDYAKSGVSQDDTPVINFSVAGEAIDKIVYNSAAARPAAEALAAAMAEKGQAVDVRLDTTMAATKNAIRISVNSPNNNYDCKITVDGTNLVINTGFASFVSGATASFITDSIKPATESVDFDVDFTRSYTTDKIYYSDFGAAGDGITDDFFNIKAAHDFANSAKRYTVCGDAGKTYYIHETRKNATGAVETIKIKTNVNWTGAEFIIDDSDISTFDGTGRATKHIFEIPSETSMTTIENSSTLQAVLSAGLNPETTKIDLGLNKKVMIIPSNSSHRIYRHRGYSSGWQGIPMSEIIVLDENGNVDPTTPLMFDYTALDSIDVYSLTDAPLTIEGGRFTTRASHINIGSSSGNMSRGISIKRANTTFKNVEHYITGEITLKEQADGMRGAAYNGFFTFTNTSDVTLDGCVLTGRRCYATALGNDGAPGTYAISAISVNKLVLKNCVQSNFWISIDANGNITNATENTPNAKPSMATSDIISGSRMHWGSIGTNYCKNMEVYDSTISRFDAHSSLYNGKIIRSTLNFISLAGGGDLIIEDIRWFAEKPSKSGNSLIYLREDYGSTWNGTIKMDGVDAYAYTSGDNYTGAYLVFHLYYNWYNGYDTYYPSLDINNLNYYDIQTRQKLPAGFLIKLCDRGVLNEPALHLPTTVNRNPLRGDSVNGTADTTSKENINIVTPPEFIKITGNSGGYVYVIPNTGRRGKDSDGGYYDDDETYGGFFGDTKFYYGDGANDYYLGTKHVGENTTTFQFHSGDNYDNYY